MELHNPLVLSTKRHHSPRLVSETIEIKKYPNFNREDGFMLSNTWSPMINSLKLEPVERLKKFSAPSLKEYFQPIQLGFGSKGGCEAAIHALRTFLQHKGGEILPKVHVKNAFNSVDRGALLNQVKLKMPASPLDLIRGPTQIPPMDLSRAKDAGKRIVWVDLEMTGLDVDKDHILEIACIVTDAELNIVASGPDLVIHQPEDILSKMNPWCVQQHGESGLTKASRLSKISLNEAENQILKFVQTYTPERKCPLGGNSVYMDRLFIRKYMPRLDQHLHYRIIDVSTIKELAKRWYQKEYSQIPRKRFLHRSIEDLEDSIEELKYYRKHVFKSNDLDISNVRYI